MGGGKVEYGRTETEIIQRKARIDERLARLGEEGRLLAEVAKKCQGERDSLLQALGKITWELECHDNERETFRDFVYI